MRDVFADTDYWIALLGPRDQSHLRAIEISVQLQAVRIVTSYWVLTEFLNGLANSGPEMRSAAVSAVDSLRSKASVTVVPQTRQAFTEALNLYRARTDKGWSMTDCSSFLIMERYGIESALTSDRHFEQAGFKALMR